MKYVQMTKMALLSLLFLSSIFGQPLLAQAENTRGGGGVIIDFVITDAVVGDNQNLTTR